MKSGKATHTQIRIEINNNMDGVPQASSFREVIVTVADSSFLDALSDKIFTDYLTRLVSTFDVVKEVCVLNATPIGKSWFFTVLSDIEHQGKKVPGFAFLRGNCVSIMPVIIPVNDDGSVTDPILTVLVDELRSPVGGLITSFPAGMIESDDGLSNGPNDSFVSAFRELTEETDDILPKGEIILKKKGVPTTPGGSDELMDFYEYHVYVFKDVYERILQCNARKAGKVGENEHITLQVVTVEKAKEINNLDMKTLLALSMFNADAF